MDFLKLFGKLFPPKRPDQKPQKLIFGLGNPGGKYHNTRHNIGFRVVDALYGCLKKKSSVQNRCGSAVVGGCLGAKEIALVKPQTYMNKSGEAVKGCLEFYGVSLSDCMVLVDDFNLPLGTVRFRKGGSHGGHNGLKSIAALVGSQYPRLRIGIGPLPQNENVIDFVLGEFSQQQENTLQKLVPETVKAVCFWLQHGIDEAMSKFNSVVID